MKILTKKKTNSELKEKFKKVFGKKPNGIEFKQFKKGLKYSIGFSFYEKK